MMAGRGKKGGVVAYICHGAWVPISAGIVKGKRATHLYAEVVKDGNLISSRIPEDLPAFCRTIISALE